MGLDRDYEMDLARAGLLTRSQNCCFCVGSCFHSGPHTRCVDHQPTAQPTAQSFTVGEFIEVISEAFDKLGLKIVPK